MSMIEEILAQMQGQPTQQVAQELGVSPNQASGAIAAALPMLIGALGHNASQSGGAEALLGALSRDHSQSAGGGLGDLLGAVMGGMGGGATRQTNGAGILGHIFGGQEQQAATQLGQATGMGGAQMQTLMKILAPIVMAYLAKRMFSGGQQADTGMLSQVLGQEQSHAQGGGGLLGSILGGADGQIDMGDILRIGGQVLGGR